MPDVDECMDGGQTTWSSACLALSAGKVGKSHQGQDCFVPTAMELEAVRFSLLVLMYLSDFTVTMAEISVLVPAHLSSCLLTESLKIQ